MKKIYITGANGFIGKTLVEHLAAKDYQVYALLRNKSLPSFSLNKNIHPVYGDLTNSNSLISSLPKGSIVVNLAANPYHKKLSYVVNVEGTKKLVEACKKRGVKKIIHISSQATKIKNQGVYAKTKSLSDQIVRESGLNYVILKPSLVYGGGEKGLFNRVRSLAKKLPFIPVFGSGQTKLFPILVEDFSKIIKLVVEDNQTNREEFDVGGKKSITYNTLYKSIVGKSVKLVHIPSALGLLAAKMMSFMPNPPFYEDNVLGSTQNTFCNPQPILDRYAFKPTNFKKGVKSILSSNKTKVCVVGLGKMGTLHLSILQYLNDVEIVALVDTNQALFNTVKSMGIAGNFYTSLDEAIKNEKIDAVYIITPTFTHLDLLKTALSKNLNVFIEKPVTLSVEQINQLKKIKTKAIVHVGYTLLFNRIFQETAKIIKDQRYGKILSFTGKFEHGEVFGPKKGWMFNKKLSGGGVLMNPGPHFFSLVNLFFGSPKKIDGEIKNIYSEHLDDEVKAKLDYGKFEGNVFLSWSVPKKDIPKNEFEIVLEKATLLVDGDKLIIKEKSKKKKAIEFSQLPPLISPIFNINPKANGEAYYIEDRQFIDEVRGKKMKVVNSLNFALATEKIVFSCYKNCQVIEVVK